MFVSLEYHELLRLEISKVRLLENVEETPKTSFVEEQGQRTNTFRSERELKCAQ